MSAAPKLKSRYEIKDRLPKQGAMGVVYRAWDLEMKRFVVIKTIGDSKNRLALDHFRQEWEILSQINHANIVDIYDIGEMEADGQAKPFFVMPFLPGATLEQLIAAQSLTVERTVEIVTQVCRGLQAAHDQGVIHRDLKPSNIFVIDEAGTVKIIDFGIAHLTDNTASVGLKGTLLYMSPEQIQMKTLKAQSDLFSLAVVSYEALTQRRPFQGATQEEIAYRILNHVPPPVSDFHPAAGPALSQVIHAAMAKQPHHRFGSAREFAEALQRALHNKPIERFDPKRVEPRILKARKALEAAQHDFAAELLGELEAEGHLHPEILQLRRQIDEALRERNTLQTLEGARRCIEEEEYALARQKVQQVLESAPGHPEALSMMAVIEEKWTSQQVAEWMRLAREHLENQSFLQARQAVQSVLGFRPSDSRALQLLSEVSRVEEHVARTRREAAELFQTARDAFARGDISAALSKAGRVLDCDRQAPDKSAPDLAAAHQNFYNEVRSEHDAIRDAVVEIRRMLAEKSFKPAYEVCDRFLARYPRDSQFRALRIDIDQKERQYLSSCVAQVDRDVSGEPDLDRRVAILRKAVGEWPKEDHFRKGLEAAVELRDLVISIAEKARQLEEEGHFSEALGQWETLRTIHAAYPHLDVETERLAARRDQQERKEARARRLNQAKRFLELGNYTEAIRIAENGLADFPDDEELKALAQAAAERRQRGIETERLIGEGHALVTRGEYDAGLKLLWQAHNLDKRNDVARSVLVNSLVRRATSMRESDPFQARELVAQALELDPSHGAARSLQSMLAGRRKDPALTAAQPTESTPTRLLTSMDAPAESAQPSRPKPDDNTRVFVPDLPEPLRQQAEKLLKPTPPQPAPSSGRWKIAVLVAGLVAASGTLAWLAVKPNLTAPPPSNRTVKLQVRAANASARIYLDGRLAAGTELELAPRDKEYIVEARLVGYKSVPVRVPVKPETTSLSPLVLHVEALPTRLALDTGMRAAYQGREVTGELELPAALHTVELTSEGSSLILKIDADTGRHPAVTLTPASMASYCVVTTLGRDGQLEMFPVAAQVTLDGAPLQPAAAKMTLSELAPGDHTLVLTGRAPIQFRSGADPSITVQAVPSSNIGGLTLNVVEDGATVTLTGPTQVKPQPVKDRRVAFSGLRPGAYSIEIVKDGFETVKDSITVQRGQNSPPMPYTLTQVKAPPTLIISGATPNTEVAIDGAVVGVVDASGQMREPNIPTGRRTFRLRHNLYDPKTFVRDISAGDQVRLTADELALVRILGIQVQNQIPGSRFRYWLKGTQAYQETTDPMLRVKQAGVYEVERLAGGKRGFKEITVNEGVVATQIPVLEDAPAAPGPIVRNLTLSHFEPPQTARDKDGWTNARNSRMTGKVESGLFDFRVQFPRGALVVNKKPARWSLATADGKCLEFELTAEKFGFGACGTDGKPMQANRAGKSQSYNVRVTVRGNNVTHEIAGDSGVAYVQQDTRALSGGPVEFRFREASLKDFRFSGVIAP